MKKPCKNCGEVKSLSEFYKSNNTQDKRESKCKACRKQRGRDLYHSNPEIRKRKSDRAKEYYKENTEYIIKRCDKWRSKNWDKVIKAADEWKKNNPEKVRASYSKRRALKRKACPKWLTEEHKQWINWLYKHAIELTNLTGIPHEIDHIHPLQGKNFCGLHVPWNLQVLTRSENRSKSNKLQE